MRIQIHTKQISVSPKLYKELEELAIKKSDTVNQIANDFIRAGLKKNAV